MKATKFLSLAAVVALISLAAPAFADSYTVYSQPTTTYTSAVTNYGGGDGSGNSISALGPFTFSSSMVERVVPTTWTTWGAPPATTSATPNVLYSLNSAALTLTLSGSPQTVGFEYEPTLHEAELVSAAFYNTSNVLIDTITEWVDGDAGAELLALTDLSSGIGYVQLSNNAGDTFALAELSATPTATTAVTPEPNSLLLIGTGLICLLGAFKLRASTAVQPNA